MTAIDPAQRVGDLDDADLVEAARAGDDRAFELLYGRYRGRIAGYVQGMVGDWARAEDVTQDVFISALRRMRETDRPIAFRPWVFEIAKNACIDQFRRSRRADEVPWDGDEGMRVVQGGPSGSPPPTPDAVAESSEKLEHLRGAFGSLSESHHEILVMRELEGRSYREIGERMGLTRPGVESTLFRARRRLSEEFDELSTGRGCLRTQAAMATAARGGVGVRERRRLARHLAWCRGCRRDARRAGLDERFVGTPASKIAAFLPLPVLDALRRLRGPGGGRDGSTLSQLAVSAGPALEPASGGWAKAAVVAFALVTAGAGAGAVREVAHDGRAPGGRAVPAESVPARGPAGAPGSDPARAIGGRRSGGATSARGGSRSSGAAGRRGSSRGPGRGGSGPNGARGGGFGGAPGAPGGPGSSAAGSGGGSAGGSARGGSASSPPRGGGSARGGGSSSPSVPSLPNSPVRLPTPPVRVPAAPVKVPTPPVHLPPVSLPPAPVPTPSTPSLPSVGPTVNDPVGTAKDRTGGILGALPRR